MDRSSLDKLLVKQGISLVPRVGGTKSPPAGFPLIKYYDGKIATLQEISSWKDTDRAAVCGIHGLVVFDFDSVAFYELFWRLKNVERIAQETLSVRTARGFQNWFFDLSLDLSKLSSTVDVSLPNPEGPANAPA
ncbi:MAG: hypothetical protein ACRECH_18495, partial [Nitrososphaerales archaeon]